MLNKIRLAVILLPLLTSIGVALTTAQQTEPNELRLAFVSNHAGNDDIYIMSLNGEGELIARLTESDGRDWDPAWSADGGQIMFNSDRDGRDTLYVMSSDGSNERALFPGETFNDYDPAYSHDGTRIAFVSERSGVGRDIYIANADGSNVQQITDSKRIKGDPSWSPDDKELLFWDQENDGRINIFRYTPESRKVVRVTSETNAGTTNGAPVWSPLGDFIYFDTNRDGNTDWSVYRVTADGASAERVTTPGVNSGRSTLSPDGKQIAFVTDRDESDEIYRMNVDGTGLTRLTKNEYSDYAPAWQPAVPPIAVVLPVQPTPATEDESSLAPVVGQSVSGIEAVPISMDRLMIEYGIQAWHDNNWFGDGQKVGVIDTAFGGLEEFRNQNGDVLLPPHDLTTDYSNDNDAHGTEVLEIIHTIAPHAELYACRYKTELADLVACRDWMKTIGVKVINHSVGIPLLPLTGKSDWAKLADDTFAQGVLWVNAAGNFNQGYYTDNFQDGPDPDKAHDFIFGNKPGELKVDLSGQLYSGNILLSWTEPPNPYADYQTDGPLPTVPPETRIDLDLEIVDAAGNILGTPGAGHTRQSEDSNEPSFERVQLSEVQTPFSIHVVNAGQEFEERIPFAIFVEYALLEGHDEVGSTVAPADARYSLTVGSVNGNRELGVYSSRGLQIAQYPKPDLSAPGEIILDNGKDFIGTSAAAPVVSGIAALLLERYPEYRIDELRSALVHQYIVPQDSQEFGAGIIQLSPPGINRSAGKVLVIPPKTVFPQIQAEFVDQGYQCPGAIPTRLETDVPGYVNFNQGLAIRNRPGGTELERLDLGQQFTVIGGPVCLSRLNWWEVELDTGATGWVGEGVDYYLIAPVNLDRAQLTQQEQFNSVCPNSIAPQLVIGQRGRVNSGDLQFYFAQYAKHETTPLSAGAIVQILGGPDCEGPHENILRWYVRVIEGPLVGYEGWAAEGDTDERLIDPLVAES